MGIEQEKKKTDRELLNERYSKLATDYGDVMFKQLVIEQRIEEIISEYHKLVQEEKSLVD